MENKTFVCLKCDFEVECDADSLVKYCCYCASPLKPKSKEPDPRGTQPFEHFMDGDKLAAPTDIDKLLIDKLLYGDDGGGFTPTTTAGDITKRGFGFINESGEIPRSFWENFGTHADPINWNDELRKLKKP